MFAVLLGQVNASFLFQATEPYCSLTGTTHTSFPGEISDTSSWSIPTVYQEECDVTPELSVNEQEEIYTIMVSFFEKYDLTGPVYGEENGYGGSDTLNPAGQDFVNDKLFPAMILLVKAEREKETPNMRTVAIFNYATKTIGYDYFISQP